jgi:hypothetical protein
VTPRLRPGDVVAFLGPSLPASEARRIAPLRILPPARAGDVLAVLPARPLAIALVDGLFDTTPSIWHHEILAALAAGVAVFGGASMGALRAAELSPFGMVGVGAVFRAYRDGVLVDDGEVALLHAGPEHGYRAFSVPLVAVRAAADAARADGVLTVREARAVVASAIALPYTERTWPSVLGRASLRPASRARLEAFLPRAPDPKAEDARTCLAAAARFARARRAGAPAPDPPELSVPSHVRRARLSHARAVLVEGRTVRGADVLAALARRPDAGRLAADGLRRALAAALARSLGYAVAPSEGDAALAAWSARLGAGRDRDALLAACALDAGAARRLGEDLALEARLLADAARVVPDGPSWEEGLALEARLTGAWLEEARRIADEKTGGRPGAPAPRARRLRTAAAPGPRRGHRPR